MSIPTKTDTVTLDGVQCHIVTTDQDTVFVYEITRALHVMSSVRRRVLEVFDAQ